MGGLPGILISGTTTNMPPTSVLTINSRAEFLAEYGGRQSATEQWPVKKNAGLSRTIAQETRKEHVD